MSSYAPLTEVQANAVYDILLEHAEEVEEYHSREQFVYAQTDTWQPEYRFMGGLGFGGKFRRRGDDTWAVDCYSEDMNPTADSSSKPPTRHSRSFRPPSSNDFLLLRHASGARKSDESPSAVGKIAPPTLRSCVMISHQPHIHGSQASRGSVHREEQESKARVLELSEELQNEGLVTLGGALANLVQETSNRPLEERAEIFVRTLKKSLNEQVQLYGAQESILTLSSSSYGQARIAGERKERARRAKLYLDSYVLLLETHGALGRSLQAATAASVYLEDEGAVSEVASVEQATSYASVYSAKAVHFERGILEERALSLAQLKEHAEVNEVFAERYREAAKRERGKGRALLGRVRALWRRG